MSNPVDNKKVKVDGWWRGIKERNRIKVKHLSSYWVILRLRLVVFNMDEEGMKMRGINVFHPSTEEEDRDIRIKQLLAKILMMKMLKTKDNKEVTKKELLKMKL